MKTLKILDRTVSVDIEKLSKGLYEMHKEDENKEAVLSFGMLDFKLCELMELNLNKAIKKQFDEHTNDLFKTRIKQFSKDCSNEITKGVYKYAKMIV